MPPAYIQPYSMQKCQPGLAVNQGSFCDTVFTAKKEDTISTSGV